MTVLQLLAQTVNQQQQKFYMMFLWIKKKDVRLTGNIGNPILLEKKITKKQFLL